MSSDYVFVDDAGNQIDPSTMGGGMSPYANNTKSDKADLLDKIKPDLIVELLRNKLLGKELKNGVWIANPILQENAVSENCAWDISNIMLSVSSQNVSLSRLKDHEIRRRTLEIVKTVQRKLLSNWKEYNLKSTSQFYFIHEIVISNTLITLKQPEGGGIRDLIKGTTTESRSVISNENQKESRWWNPLRR